MSSGNYGYVILKNGIPVGGGNMRYHVTNALMEIFVNYSIPGDKINGIIRSIESMERGDISVWRVNKGGAADITVKMIEIQKERLIKECGNV